MKGKKSKKATLATIDIAKLVMVAIGFILVVAGFFVEDLMIPFKLVGLLLIMISSIMHVAKSEKYPLLKSVLIVFVTGIIFSWIMPYGFFTGSTYTEYGMSRIGLSDLSNIIYNSAYFSLDKIIYLFVIGAFYAVCSKTKGYQNLVNSLAKKVEKNNVVSSVIIALVFIILTTFISQIFVVFTFIPFVISILAKAKFDKVTSFAITFGAIIIGALGAVYGTEGLYWFTYYSGIDAADGLTYRAIVQVAAAVLYVLFIVLRLSSQSKKDIVLLEDQYEVGKGDKKVSSIPTIIILSLTGLFLILGFVAWFANFEITMFTEFHTWLIELEAGEGNTVVSYILGADAKAFGSFDMFMGISALIVSTILVAVSARLNVSETIDAVGKGLKIMAKPVMYIIGVFAIFITVYICSYTATFSSYILGLSDTFNPNVLALDAVISSIFHVDFGYTGYIIGQYLTTTAADSLGLASTIYVAISGLVQLIVPSGAILVTGLVFTKVNYKSWLKYISMFVVGLLLILIITFNVIAYIA